MPRARKRRPVMCRYCLVRQAGIGTGRLCRECVKACYGPQCPSCESGDRGILLPVDHTSDGLPIYCEHPYHDAAAIRLRETVQPTSLTRGERSSD